VPTHPDLEAEQAYVDYAYDCLEAARRRAASLGSMVEVGRGGTEQAHSNDRNDCKRQPVQARNQGTQVRARHVRFPRV
jgi:hypothetical protein